MSPGDLDPAETMSGQALTNFHDKSQNVRLAQPLFNTNHVSSPLCNIDHSLRIWSRPTTVHCAPPEIKEAIQASSS